MNARRRFVAACGCVLMLPACGGGDDDALPGSDDSDAATRGALETTNGGFDASVLAQDPPGSGNLVRVLARWELPIPVKTQGDAEAIAAMNAIESRLGGVVFDRTSIASTADADVNHGILVKRGVANCPGATGSCGSVSGSPGRLPVNLPPGVIRTKLDLALGGVTPDGRTLPSNLDVAIHEFGHALGMMGHFGGFGSNDPANSNSPAISPLFWRVLRTTYANAPGTRLDRAVLAAR